MSNRYLGGYLTASYNPLLVPNPPTIGTATAGDASATVAFTAPSNIGGAAITSYVAVSSPGGFTGTGTTSPITVTGLTNGTPYTFTVYAVNAYGPSDLSASSNSITPATPAADGLFGGGVISGGVQTNVINYVNIASTGNATDFGDLTLRRYAAGACSSSTRGVWGGGFSEFIAAPYLSNTIDYVTIASAGNATDFGDLTNKLYFVTGCSNSTRGLFAGGNNDSTDFNVIEYITIASVGNATDFGDLTRQQRAMGACASPTRGVFAGGVYTNTIDYVSINSLGNATDFGDLTIARGGLAGCSTSTRGVFGGGNASGTQSNVIDYITIASTGNAIDFGDLTIATSYLGACSSTVRGVFGGGTAARTDVISYITIASTGNAASFGSLIQPTDYISGCSNAHGGL